MFKMILLCISMLNFLSFSLANSPNEDFDVTFGKTLVPIQHDEPFVDSG
jgi:hypothetical protein